MTPRRSRRATIRDRLFAAGESPHDRRQRSYVGLGLAILIPFIAYVSRDAWQQGKSLDSGLMSLLAILLLAVLIALVRSRRAAPAYRVSAAASLLMMAYGLHVGAWGGFSFLWFYLLPTFVVFLLGRLEGIVWTLGAAALSAYFLFAPVGHVYPAGVALRYLITYFVVALLALSLESSRAFYQARLRAERAALREALEQVAILRGLLPMCPSCKKVRDDGGYWQQLEGYISRRSEAEFSHGLCPKCAAAAMAEIGAMDEELELGAVNPRLG